MHIVSNCPLCEERALHVIGENETQTQQCINCGFVTAPKFKYENDLWKHLKAYTELTEEMQAWSVRMNNYIWIPTIMTLPFGILYPFNNEEKELKWGFAEMKDIPEKERKNYPVEGQSGKFYERMYDTDNAKVFDTFVEGLVELNKTAKFEDKVKEINLPKLKKVK